MTEHSVTVEEGPKPRTIKVWLGYRPGDKDHRVVRVEPASLRAYFEIIDGFLFLPGAVLDVEAGNKCSSVEVKHIGVRDEEADRPVATQAAVDAIRRRLRHDIGKFVDTAGKIELDALAAALKAFKLSSQEFKGDEDAREDAG